MKEQVSISQDDFLKREFEEQNNFTFDELFHKYSKKVYGISKSFCLSHQDAEEIVQEVFIKLWNNIKNLDPTFSIQAYIISITKNSILNFLRKKAVRQNYLQDLARSNQKNKNHVEDFIYYNDLLSKLNQCINNLPPQRQKIFTMVCFEGFSSEEISSKLHLSKRTVEHHLYIANKFIRKQLNVNCK